MVVVVVKYTQVGYFNPVCGAGLWTRRIPNKRRQLLFAVTTTPQNKEGVIIITPTNNTVFLFVAFPSGHAQKESTHIQDCSGIQYCMCVYIVDDMNVNKNESGICL
jgi:hypothetical protein